MKNIFNKLVPVLAVASLLASCVPSENEIDKGDVHEKITFTLSGTPTIVAFDGDKVDYVFDVAYANGLKEIYVSLDGKEIEGSKAEYADAPTEADFKFEYQVTTAQAGQTLDFVFTAVGADDYSCSTDYALYVSASATLFTVAVPASAPSKINLSQTATFTVNVECGRKLAKIRTLKNGTEIPSLTKTEGFSSATSDQYAFSYTPDAAEVNSTIAFVFEATDEKNNTESAEYNVQIVPVPVVGKTLYSEIFDTSMSISNTTAFDTEAGGVSGNAATNFDTKNLVSYTGDNAEVTEGVKEGLTVYDGDKTAIHYAGDGTNTCLSKYKYAALTLASGTYVWMKKSTGATLTVTGIKLYECYSFELSYSQCGGSLKAEYGTDGTTWTELGSTASTAEQSFKFSVANGEKTIALRFTENGSAHVRLDNIKLIEVVE